MPEINAPELMKDMGLTVPEIESRLHAARVGAPDVANLQAVGNIIVDYAKAATDEFIEYLRSSPETNALLDDDVVRQIRLLKQAHIRDMGRGEYGEMYVQQRIGLALIYSELDMPVRWFLGAFQHLIRFIGMHIIEAMRDQPEKGLAAFMSLNKLSTFDASLMVDTLVFQREQTIREQEEAIRELSTPVLRVRDRLLILPVIGAVDRARARLLTDGLLQAIRVNRARVVIMDVTGVPHVDTTVATHLVQAIEASRLMGATIILTGLAPEIAHTIVTLGVDLTSVYTVGDLQGGLEEGERLLGYIVKKRSPPLRLSSERSNRP